MVTERKKVKGLWVDKVCERRSARTQPNVLVRSVLSLTQSFTLVAAGASEKFGEEVASPILTSTHFNVTENSLRL